MESTPSTSSPPKDAPAWAVRDGYQQDSDNPGEGRVAPPVDPPAVTPASSRSSEISSRPRRILGERDVHQAINDFDSSDDDESDSDA